MVFPMYFILNFFQVHNAGQLGEFCLRYLSQNYNYICRKFPKILRNLHPENQACLNVNRWPPIWYLKDHDNYQRMLLDQERLQKRKPKKSLKRVRTNSGCLCFSSKSRKDQWENILLFPPSLLLHDFSALFPTFWHFKKQHTGAKPHFLSKNYQ